MLIKAFLAAGLSAGIAILAGCATGIEKDTMRSDVAIETADSRKGRVSDVRVVEWANETTVYGQIRRVATSRILKGHVHVDVYDRRGGRIESATTDYVFRRLGLRVAQMADFSVVFPRTVPESSHVVVTHHDADIDEHRPGALVID